MAGGGRRQSAFDSCDTRGGKEAPSKACPPMGSTIRAPVLRMAHLNAGFLVKVRTQQDGKEPPVAIIANCPGNARVERAGSSPIWIGLVQLGLQYLNTRRRTVDSLP